MLSYQVIKERFNTEELGCYESYGIAAVCGNKQVAYIPDVFTEIKEAEDSAELFTSMELDPDHLFEVICDRIGTI